MRDPKCDSASCLLTACSPRSCLFLGQGHLQLSGSETISHRDHSPSTLALQSSGVMSLGVEWCHSEIRAGIPSLLFSRNARIQVSANKGSFFPIPMLGLAARPQTRPCMKTQLRNYKGKLYHFLLTQKCLEICLVWTSTDRTD